MVRPMSLLSRLLTSRPARSRSPEPPRSIDPVVPPADRVDPSMLFALPAEALVGISGESHYTSAISALSRSAARSPRGLTVTSDVAEDVAQREPGRELRWFEAQLVPMPDNPYDANAVAVVSPHGQVGYLPRDDAAQYAEVFVKLRQLGYAGAICPAFVDVEKSCVVIVLSWPSVCLPEVNAERRRRAWEAWRAGDALDGAAADLGFGDLSKFLTAARQHAKAHGLEVPPTASEMRRKAPS
jgi:hypothetical protein